MTYLFYKLELKICDLQKWPIFRLFGENSKQIHKIKKVCLHVPKMILFVI